MTIFADTRSTAPSSLPFDVSGQRPACVRRVSACACGGEIVVERGEDIATVVRPAATGRQGMTVTAIFPGITADEGRQAAAAWADAEPLWSLAGVRVVEPATLHDGSPWHEHWRVELELAERAPTLWEARHD